MAAKQKQSQAARRRGGSSRGSGLAWFLAGTITGGLVTWAAIGRDPAAEQVRTMVGRTVGQPIGVDPAAPPPKPKFEFYTLLPEMEVVVPEEELAAPPPAAKDAPAKEDATAASEGATAGKDAPTAEEPAKGTDDSPGRPGTVREPGGHYIVQVASFRNVKDADGLKARLTLLGFEPVVQGVVISGDEKRYRVRLGPYPDRDSLEAARTRLKANGHDKPLVVRVKKG